MQLGAALPRQLSLAGFSESLETTRATDDAILRAAIGRLFEIPEFTTLTRAAQEVLIALLARRDFRAPAALHPSTYNQGFVAQAAGVSRSTVKRAYAVFEEYGWLVRGEQSYDARKRRYEGTPVAFSAAFVESLALARTFDSAAKEIAPRAPVSQFTGDTEMAPSPVVQNEPLIKEDSFEQSSSKRQSPTAGDGHKPVPRELFCLIEKGLSCWTVFWLMKLAGKTGKRLSDIVEIKRAAIEKRRGRLLVGFLQHLIRQNIDYVWQKRELESVAQEQAETHRSECELGQLENQLVCVDGGEQAVRIRKGASGYRGELVGVAGSIPYADLLKLVRAGRITLWRKPEEQEQTDLGNAPAASMQSSRTVAQDALSRIRLMVGVRAA